MTTIEIAYYCQEWVNDYAVDLPGTPDTFELAGLSHQVHQKLTDLAEQGGAISDIEYILAEHLRQSRGFTWSGPFYVRLVIDGVETDDMLTEDESQALIAWLQAHRSVDRRLHRGFDELVAAADTGTAMPADLARLHSTLGTRDQAALELAWSLVQGVDIDADFPHFDNEGHLCRSIRLDGAQLADDLLPQVDVLFSLLGEDPWDVHISVEHPNIEGFRLSRPIEDDEMVFDVNLEVEGVVAATQCLGAIIAVADQLLLSGDAQLGI